MTPAPPHPFPAIHRHVLHAGETIVRVHDRQFSADSFNPGRGSRTRFAPLVLPSGQVIPHLYAAQSFECAAFESVFHDVQHDAAHKAVAMARVDGLELSELRCRRDLSLACLFQPDLNAWKIHRSDLIDTHASAYRDTVTWAVAIHEAHDVDGLIWTSRRCDPQLAMILFGDRVAPDELDIVSGVEIAADNGRLSELRGFGARAGIVLTL